VACQILVQLLDHRPLTLRFGEYRREGTESALNNGQLFLRLPGQSTAFGVRRVAFGQTTSPLLLGIGKLGSRLQPLPAGQPEGEHCEQ